MDLTHLLCIPSECLYNSIYSSINQSINQQTPRVFADHSISSMDIKGSWPNQEPWSLPASCFLFLTEMFYCIVLLFYFIISSKGILRIYLNSPRVLPKCETMAPSQLINFYLKITCFSE